MANARRRDDRPTPNTKYQPLGQMRQTVDTIRKLLTTQRQHIKRDNIDALEASILQINELIETIRAYQAVYRSGGTSTQETSRHEPFMQATRYIDAEIPALIELHAQNRALLSEAINKKSGQLRNRQSAIRAYGRSFPDQARNILIDAHV